MIKASHNPGFRLSSLPLVASLLSLFFELQTVGLVALVINVVMMAICWRIRGW